ISGANTMWNAAQQMSIGLGIAFGALALRVASSFHERSMALADSFTLHDFRFAFQCAGALTLVSIYGYAKLTYDAGRKLSGSSR
ncbi:MFS transporter, partial [Klebsiella pneumoniae]|nr:MFS transporter [Klebsiella pneumoniae]